jgi:hypothetical protein
LTDFLRPQGHVVGGLWSPRDQLCAARVVGRPLRETVLAQEVLEVELQFFETGTGDVGQLQLGLL